MKLHLYKHLKIVHHKILFLPSILHLLLFYPEAILKEKIDCAKKVVLYAGEKEIPSQYITSPDGYKVYGIYTEDESMIIYMS